MLASLVLSDYTSWNLLRRSLLVCLGSNSVLFYALLVLGIGLALLHFPGYIQLALRRLHYYITGE